MSDDIARATRDYIRGRHSPDWPAGLARLRDATDSAEQKAFADEVIACIQKNAQNPAKANAAVRDVMKRTGVKI